VRGRPPLDVGAAARVAATLSQVAASHPDIAEIEINPLLVTPSGATALDARVIEREEGEDDAR
jgi:succinyl-CoA synthetase beta subunit